MSAPQTSWSGAAYTGRAPDNRCAESGDDSPARDAAQIWPIGAALRFRMQRHRKPPQRQEEAGRLALHPITGHAGGDGDEDTQLDTAGSSARLPGAARPGEPPEGEVMLSCAHRASCGVR
jgi:hypothetical protein